MKLKPFSRDYGLARRIEPIDPQGILAKEELISLAEAAVISGLSAGHLRLLAEQKVLKARKIGRNWVTSKEAVAAYMRDKALRSRDPLKRKR